MRKYKKILEKQWGDSEDRKTFNPERFRDLIGKKTTPDDFQKRRHLQQPNLFNIYLRQGAGDYKGRIDQFNSVAIKNVIRPETEEELRSAMKNIEKKERKMLKYKKDPRRKYAQADKGSKPGDDTGEDSYALAYSGDSGGEAEAMGESQISEKEWGEEGDKESFTVKRFTDLMSTLDGQDEFNDHKHKSQPTVYGLFFKSRGGDYRGRTDMMNSKGEVHWGTKDLGSSMKDLKKRADRIKSDKGYNKKYGHLISKESFGFADFVEKIKSRKTPKTLTEVPVDEINFGGASKNVSGVSPYLSSSPGRPYDQPMKNRLSRGNQPPNDYPPRNVDDDEEDSFMEVDMQTGTRLDQKKRNKIDHVPNQNPRELMQSVHDELVKELDLDSMIDYKFSLLRMEADDAYKKFFKKMMAKWGISSPTELSYEDKKKFFNSVDQQWQGKEEKKGKYREED
jgi:hypothetical protein